MRPLQLAAKNYRSFAKLDLPLPEGCVALVGPNGSGKSSIVNLIDLCLFGGPLAQNLTENAQHPMSVLLDFEHGGVGYRVIRGYSPKGRGSTSLDLWRANEGEEWQPHGRETQKETQAAIDELLGLSRETFRASAFLAQGDGAAFTEAQPRDRKAILAEVLGLGVWDRLHERARVDLKDTQRHLDITKGRIEGLDEELEKLPAAEESVKNVEANLHVAQGDLASVRQQYELARNALERGRIERERIERLRVIVEACQQKHAALEDQAQRAHEEREYLLGAYKELHALPNAEELPALITVERLIREVQEIEAKRLKVDVMADVQTCPTCGQTVGKQEREKMQQDDEALATQIAELRTRIALTMPPGMAPNEVPQLLVLAREADARRKELTAREKSAPAPVEEFKLNSSLEELTAARHDYEEARRQAMHGSEVTDGDIAVFEDNLPRLEKRVDELRSKAAGLSERLVMLAEAREMRADLLRDYEEDVERVGQLEILERAYGRDGIPAMIVETSAIPYLEDEASRILSELGTDFRVELRTTRALKAGGEADALDIAIVVGGAAVRPYESFSGGERTRINLALRIALARLLSHRRGADSRVLVIDEPEFLDEAGTVALAEVLRELREDFDSIYLVSHVPTLRHAFDQTIEVSRNGTGYSEVA